MLIQNWVDVIAQSLQSLWLQVVSFLPSLVGALLVFLVGLIVASVLGQVVARFVSYVKFDTLLKQLGADTYLQRANMKLNTGHFFGELVYWFILVAFLLAASELLGFGAFSSFLSQVLAYIPNVVVATLIMLASLVVGRFLKHLVRASVMSAKLHHAKGLATIAWWAVVVVGFLAALSQLGVAPDIVRALVTGFVAMIAIAMGLAFGLGGKDMAASFLEKVRDDMTHRP